MAGFAGEEKPSALQMLARFLRGNLFIPDPRRGWNKFALKEAFKIIAENNIKTVITTGPPHSTHLLGLKIKSKCKVQWIADFRDPWTDIYYYKQFLHLPPAVALDRYYEKTVLEKSDRVIVISNDMKRLFLGKSNLLKQNSIHVLPNGYDDADFEKVTPAAPKKTPSLVYTGTLTPSYPLSSILEALKKSNGFKPLQLEFIGSVSHPALSQLPDISGISVSILPHIPHHDSVSAIAGASCLLFLIPETSSYKVLPGKLFEYIRSGPPILGIGPTDGDAAAILSDTGAGKMFAPQDIEGIEDYLKQILQGIVPKRNANVISSFSREAQADELLSWVV